MPFINRTTLSDLMAFSIHPVISAESSGGGPTSSGEVDDEKEDKKDGTTLELIGRATDVSEVVLAITLSILEVTLMDGEMV